MLLFRRAAVIISVVAMCATPALAKRVGTPAPPEDNDSRTQPHSPAAEVQAPRPATPVHTGNPIPEETPVCMTPPSRLANAGRTENVRLNAPEPTRQPSAPEPSQERREKAKPVLSPMPRAARQGAPHRARVTTRPLPAAPGMGTLIRMGMTVGREISFLEESVPSRPNRPNAGRAPPATRVSSASALATPAAPLHPAESHLTGFAPCDSHELHNANAVPQPDRLGAALACPIGSGRALAATLGGFVS